ncbi:MAG: class I SAM-dependent methyltransferase [Betaproteobacteria bacterium]|nr:class I SAM-dependent methyltransferase [Betaproteobacteria bacterium]
MSDDRELRPASAHDAEAPSVWVLRWSWLIPPGARLLDVACGRGRHTKLFNQRGCQVTAVDRDQAAISALAGPGVTALMADLEADVWPFAPGSFDAVVVTNYLFRPLFPMLAAVLADNGLLLYETFAVGNEHYGRPSNPAFLLRRNELQEQFGDNLNVLCFEQGLVGMPKPAVVQRICARKSAVWRPESLESGTIEGTFG